MPELTKEQIEMIVETHDTVMKDHTTLFGQNGDPGLIGKVNNVCDEHNTLNRNFWILVAFLGGSGVLGGSLWALLH